MACLAALRAHTDGVKNTGDPRTRDQIMADTLVERVTGQASAGDVSAAVAIVIPVTALTNPETLTNPESGDVAGQTAEVVGHGPIPAGLATEILAGSRGRRWWRRLFTAAHGGVVGGDPARRRFDGTVIVTQPGSKSQQNAQRRGFDLLYTRAVLVKHHFAARPRPDRDDRTRDG